MSLRGDLLAQLTSKPFDLLIIGGGIVGAGIARDAAMRGLKVALIEQGDFASGTSSKTSKLIHGGLRYLEQGHLGLVYESLRERQVLRMIAPAYVHPLSLLLPVYAKDPRPAWKITLGLGLYDLLAWGRNIRRHRMVSARRALALEPALRVDGLRAAGVYADCRMDDARLCLLNVLQAVGFGAVCANYVRLQRLLKADQRVCGGVGEDVLTGRSFEMRAKAVVNAAGPWADRVRALSDAQAPPRLAPTKGIHLIVPRLAQEALFMQARSDGRMLFLLPWGHEYSLIGTTETPITGSLDALSADANDIGYLLDEVNRVLPGSHLDEEDIVASFAGARPLLAFSGPSTTASREHRIEVDRWGLVSVMGGKFTTYRLMAQQTVDFLIRRHRWDAERCLTDQVSLLEAAHPVALDHWQEMTRRMDQDLLARLIIRYGTAAFQILKLIDREPALVHPVCPHHEHIEAELVHAFQQELACTITDVLARRTRIAWSSCQGLDLLSTLLELAQRYAGFPPALLEQQVGAYRQFLQRSRGFRGEARASGIARASSVSHDGS
ncbi:MAG: glycerol-3-phosphate dehydrogenase/oxidase [Candidatus Omnitrophica bacterium]|nr:glycerol-3-phosphate dehydrogenase/oxidase [Candidatus Omnitrophota bacterium]